ncbi:MAG: PAS domain S-box protein [Magnetococcales bacterium]|nr:PAS domain S-box protein [Magnetococcales bacterium]NGZ05897.1 PAS domain S-box protein [Magnetococcales bacterium]
MQAFHLHQETDNLARIQQELHQKITSHLHHSFQEIQAATTILTQVEALQTPFRQQDRSALQQAAQPLLAHLRAHNTISHLYFHTPEMITFLRVHQPERHGDTVLRLVNQRAYEKSTTSQGVELGPLGTLTLRVVMPWKDQHGSFLGFMETGREFSLILKEMSTNGMVTQLHLFLDKAMIHNDQWHSRQQLTPFPTDIWERFSRWVWIGGTTPKLPKELNDDLMFAEPGWASHLQRLLFGKFHLHALHIPVTDVAGREVGKIVALIDEQEQRLLARSHFLILIPGILITGSLLIGFYMTTLKRVEHHMETQGQQLLTTVAAHQASESTMRQLERQHRMMLEAVGDGIFGIDRTGKTTFINPAGLKILGFAPTELIGHFHHALIHHTRPDGTPYPFESCPTYASLQSGETRLVENELYWRADGTAIPVEYTSTPIVDDQEITGAVVVFRDVRARQTAERQQQQNLMFQQVINRIHAASFKPIPLTDQLEQALDAILTIPWLFMPSSGVIFLTDPDTPSRLVMTVQRGLHPEQLQQVRNLPLDHCLCGRVAVSRELTHHAALDERHDIHDPHIQPHDHYVVPLLAQDRLLGVMTFHLQDDHAHASTEKEMIQGLGHTVAAIIERWEHQEQLRHTNQMLEERIQERTRKLEHHVAELHRYQEQLIRSERMAALGTMVAGLSHEINTPIGIGYTASTHLQAQLATLGACCRQEPLRNEVLAKFMLDANEAVRLIVTNLARTNDLVHSFKGVAVDQTSETKRQIRLKEYLEQIILSLRPQLRTCAHRIAIDCPDQLEWSTWPGSLAQIITNLILNSLIHAFPPGKIGVIIIQVTSEDPKHLTLIYQDNGQGMTPEVRKQIFEPFFTTRRNAGGSGLGMHVVYNIVTQQMGGSIACESTEGKGVTFRMRFPRHETTKGETA